MYKLLYNNYTTCLGYIHYTLFLLVWIMLNEHYEKKIQYTIIE